MISALLLAAGKGSRMKDLTSSLPKHLLPVGGRPVLEHVVIRLRDVGIVRQVIVIGYLAEMVEAHFGDGSQFGVDISYVRQEKLDGTGSAALAAKDAIGDAPFLMTFGDILASAETYSNLLEDYQREPCDILTALNWVEDPHTGAAVYLSDDSKALKIIEKPPVGASTTNWNQAGIFIFSPLIFEYASKLTLSQRGEYELTEAVSAEIRDGRSVRGYKMSGIWCDVGRPEDLGKAERMLEGDSG